MEFRIEEQAASIQRAKLLGEDTSNAEYRLKLLYRALDEMRIQLGSLHPTVLDAKRPKESSLTSSGPEKVR